MRSKMGNDDKETDRILRNQTMNKKFALRKFHLFIHLFIYS